MPPGGDFPPTDWVLLQRVRDGSEGDRRAALETLIVRYRGPLWAYLRGRGFRHHHAEDILQDFLAFCLSDGLFEKADAGKGRFRNLLLVALNRFAAKSRRRDAARVRRPEGGMLSMEEAGHDGRPLEIAADAASAETAFNRAWADALLAQVLGALERECAGSGKAAHFAIFRRCVVAPSLEGSQPPSHRDLARELGLTEKAVANRLLTARRAYQRLLRETIGGYVRGEGEIDAEIRELFAAAASG